MNIGPHERLAATLDKTPNGFVRIEDGTHLRVLEWIFTPEEAELASQMKMRGETAEELARRFGVSERGLVEQLETMAKKGQIRAWNSSTGRRYSLIVFIGGIWENQMDRADPRLAALMEDTSGKGVGRDFSTPSLLSSGSYPSIGP